jgi:hypothetical protein
MSTLSDNTTRRALEMAGSHQHRNETTHKDGYEHHTPQHDTIRHWLRVQELRRVAYRCDEGIIS